MCILRHWRHCLAPPKRYVFCSVNSCPRLQKRLFEALGDTDAHRLSSSSALALRLSPKKGQNAASKACTCSERYTAHFQYGFFPQWDMLGLSSIDPTPATRWNRCTTSKSVIPNDKRIEVPFLVMQPSPSNNPAAQAMFSLVQFSDIPNVVLVGGV